MAQPGVTAIILHPDLAAPRERLVTVLHAARSRLADRHAALFRTLGSDVRIVSEPPDDRSFGARVRGLVRRLPAGEGVVLLGSGAVPLASRADLARFVAAAATTDGPALANNRYSADVIAIPRARAILGDVPDLPTDNVLPRWLADAAGLSVHDLARRWRLGVDLDSPLDLVLLGRAWADLLDPTDRAGIDDRRAAIRAVAADDGAEVVVSGRSSPSTLAWLTRATASRTRALLEERGLRTSVPGQRPSASVLGMLLDRDGPAALGMLLARLGEAAVVDSRVLLAHRLGADERGWPAPADRFASDLLLHAEIVDPWLRELTRAAAEAPIPILLGAHTLVGPGLRLLFAHGAGQP